MVLRSGGQLFLNFPGEFFSHERHQLLYAGAADLGHTPKIAQKPLFPLFSDAHDLVQL